MGSTGKSGQPDAMSGEAEAPMDEAGAYEVLPGDAAKGMPVETAARGNRVSRGR